MLLYLSYFSKIVVGLRLQNSVQASYAGALPHQAIDRRYT